MTCAACHTAVMTYNGKTVTVDGGPTLADFQKFIEELNAAVSDTNTDPAKFQRFAVAVLGADNLEPNTTMLHDALGTLVRTQQGIAALNHTDLRYGFGRLDAVGNILNKIAFVSGAANPPNHPADAPTSYPFLWNTPQHDHVEWDGVGDNRKLPGLDGPGLDVGALARNTGEVIGVFGDIITEPHPGLKGFESSANIFNLVAHENLLRKLRPPKWPVAIFGEPDNSTTRGTRRGKTLFAEKCAGCHAVMDRSDLTSPIIAHMSPLLPGGSEPPIGTDPWMACNAVMFMAPAGNLIGLKVPTDGLHIEDPAPLISMLAASVEEVLFGKKPELVGSVVGGFVGIRPRPTPAPRQEGQLVLLLRRLSEIASPLTEKQRRKIDCLNTPADGRAYLAYKARPLNGIWATAPYLHNGSVATLYDLLLPVGARRGFNVGSREFDPNHVGYVTTPGPDNSFVFDPTLEGNSNAGHDYNNASFSDDDRQALVEYMKTL